MATQTQESTAEPAKSAGLPQLDLPVVASGQMVWFLIIFAAMLVFIRLQLRQRLAGRRHHRCA